MVTRKILTTPVSGILVAGIYQICNTDERKFEHVMNIGSEGTGPGQFKYVESV